MRLLIGRQHSFLLDGTVILSDGAGQLAVGQHALIWWFYADLKAYCAEPRAIQVRRCRRARKCG